MGTTITIAPVGSSAPAPITITGDGVYLGPTYNRLDGWYGLSNIELNAQRRPNAAGSFLPRRSFPGERAISIEGSFFGDSRPNGLAMRERISALYNDGGDVIVTVADDLRTTSCRAKVESVTLPWTIHPEFDYTIDLVAADPRRYSSELSASTPLPSPGTGLPWPLVYPLNWGTPPIPGRLTTTNDGNAETASRFTVGGGTMPDGFDIANISTGQRVSYIGPVYAGDVILVDFFARTATINGNGQGSRYLAAPEWWTVPPRTTYEIQFVARGGVTGDPTLTAYTASAFY